MIKVEDTDVTIESCYYKGTVAINLGFGGIIGNCENINSKTTISKCWALMDVQALRDDIGGIVNSVVNCDIKNSFSIMNVDARQNIGGIAVTFKGGTIQNCYAAGNVKGKANVNGIVAMGDTDSTEIISCFYDSDSFKNIDSKLGNLSFTYSCNATAFISTIDTTCKFTFRNITIIITN
jgi:hypothetical protein